MTFLYFLLDIVFYNFTPWKTTIFLLSFAEKEKNISKLFQVLIADYLFHGKGRLFFLFFTLFLINKPIKLNNYRRKELTIRILFLNMTFLLLLYIIKQVCLLDKIGFCITLLFLQFSYKRKATA